MRVGERLGLSDAERVELYYAGLLMDAGCTAATRMASGAELPVGARILAVVDRFDELSAEHGTESALDQVMADAGRGLCPEACRALGREFGGPGTRTEPTTPVAKPLPNGLTEREVEVLNLLAQGNSRAQIATRLVLSEHTVRHHIEHIYDKLGVSTRVAAALFAVEHDLID
jgi:DNA-binding CsgD family transcriptional regulator